MTDGSSIQSSIALIERGLRERPIGSTLCEMPPPRVEVPVELDSDPELFRKALPPTHPRPCATKCGATVTYPGLCSTCGDAVARADAALEFKAAFDSIPAKFRWARVDDPTLDARCGIVLDKKGGPLLCHGRPMSMSRNVVPRIVSQLLSGRVRNYTLRGGADVGKTSVACAAIQMILDRAIVAWIAFMRSRKPGRCLTEEREPRIVTLARGARFIATRDLMPPKDRGPGSSPMYGAAMKATIAVLDDIGQEAMKSEGKREDSYAMAERLQATRDFITGRWDLELPIIGTTFLDDAGILGMYAGGVQKRLVKSNHVSVIEFRKRGTENV